MSRSRRSQPVRAGRVDRRDVLDAAGALLSQQGPGALTMRDVANELGVSTMPLYTLFDGKEGLLQGLVAAGVGRLADALGVVQAGEGWGALRALAEAYRRFANENRVLFAWMWSASSAWGSGGPPEARAEAEAVYRCLQDAVADVMAELDRSAREIEPAARCFWAALHGFCSLEVDDCFGSRREADAAFAATLDFVERGLRARGPASNKTKL